MIPRQEEHLEIYLQYIQKHCPGFLWNFVNFDCNEEDFIIPDKPKYRDCERMEAETLGIFAPPICTYGFLAYPFYHYYHLKSDYLGFFN